MARKKNDIEMARTEAVKRLRSRVRLETSIIADRVLNNVLDEFNIDFDRRVAAGESYELIEYDEWVAEAVHRLRTDG